MKSKTKIFFSFFTFLSFLFVIQIIYLQNKALKETNYSEYKATILQSIGLPNLVISSNDLALRHKSYTNIFDTLPNDGELHTNSKMSFVY